MSKKFAVITVEAGAFEVDGERPSDPIKDVLKVQVPLFVTGVELDKDNMADPVAVRRLIEDQAEDIATTVCSRINHRRE